MRTPWIMLPGALSGCIVFSDPPASVARDLALQSNRNFVSLGVGWQAACATTERGITACFGKDENDDGLIDVPNRAFDLLTASTSEQVKFCGIAVDGSLSCWGRTHGGQSTVFEPPDDVGGLLELTLGSEHACVLDESGLVTCWGDDSAGQLEPNLRDIIHIEAGGDSTCALATNHKVSCWGGVDGLPPRFDDIDSRFTGALAVGDDFFCRQNIGSSAETVFDCFDDAGPVDFGLPEIDGTYEMEAGDRHLCLLDEAGELSCYGDDEHGQLEVPEEGPWAAMSLGYQSTCGLLADSGEVHCWGLMPNPAHAGH